MEIFKLLHKVTTSSGRGSLLLNCAVDASTSPQECTLGSGRQFRSTYAGPLLSRNTQKGDWQWSFGKKKSFSQALTRKQAYFCRCFDLQLCITATLLMWYNFLVQLGEKSFTTLYHHHGHCLLVCSDVRRQKSGMLFFSDIWQHFGCNYSTQQLTVS